MFRHLIVIWLLSFLSASQSVAEMRKLKFCGDKAGWPPYTYELDGSVKGYDIDVLDQLLKPEGIEYQVYMLPWKRCLKFVEDGTIDVVVSASGTKQRENIYRLTERYYSVEPHYFYLSSSFPKGLHLSASEAAKKYTVCGLRGYDYSNFGLASEEVIRTSNSFIQLVKKIEGSRRFFW